LHTLFCEAEAIANSRPLTVVSSDPADLSPLSPSMLLTMKPQRIAPPPGIFVKADVFCRKRWRRTQYLADVLWNRWRRDFIAAQQPRQKW
ncbi:hypothetical protein CAPTEDRAFT_31549, partial [Capitella teleta]